MKFHDYYRQLTAEKQERLIDALAAWTLQFFFPHGMVPNPANESPAFEHFQTTRAQMWDWRYVDSRTLKTLSTLEKSGRYAGEFGRIPVEVLERARVLRPTRTTLIRRLVKVELQRRLKNCSVTNEGGGVWLYRGTLDECDVCVEIDYAGSYHQLRYSVDLSFPRRRLRVFRLSFETLCGFGMGDWDHLTEENTEHSCTLLAEIVQHLARLPARLPVEYVQTFGLMHPLGRKSFPP